MVSLSASGCHVLRTALRCPAERVLSQHIQSALVHLWRWQKLMHFVRPSISAVQYIGVVHICAPSVGSLIIFVECFTIIRTNINLTTLHLESTVHTRFVM